jgi:hypothetical protein
MTENIKTENIKLISDIRQLLAEQAREALLSYVTAAAEADRARRAAAELTELLPLTLSMLHIIKTVRETAEEVQRDALDAFRIEIRGLLEDDAQVDAQVSDLQ